MGISVLIWWWHGDLGSTWTKENFSSHVNASKNAHTHLLYMEHKEEDIFNMFTKMPA